jgi:hypothetical protein
MKTDDGNKWHQSGCKQIKLDGKQYKKHYYKCASKGCSVKLAVTYRDPPIYEVQGDHVHVSDMKSPTKTKKSRDSKSKESECEILMKEIKKDLADFRVKFDMFKSDLSDQMNSLTTQSFDKSGFDTLKAEMYDKIDVIINQACDKQEKRQKLMEFTLKEMNKRITGIENWITLDDWNVK